MNAFRLPWRVVLPGWFIALAAVMPSPANGQADEAKKLFDSLYTSKMKAAAATRDPADDNALAAQMLEGARQSVATPALLMLLCEHAYTLAAADPAGYETAAEAMRLLAANHPNKAAAARDNIVDLRRKQFGRAKSDEKALAGGLYVDALLDAGELKAELSDHAGAVAQFRLALATARQVKATNAEDIRARLDRAQVHQKLHDRISSLRAKILQDANDKAAATDLVMLYIVELNDIRSAARYAAQTGDDKLKARLDAMVKAPIDLDEKQALDLGDWHRERAIKAPPASRGPVLARAVEYYNRFLMLHTAEDLARKGAQLAFNEAVQALVAMDYKPGAGAPRREPTVAARPDVDPGLADGKSLPSDKWIDILPLVEAKHCTRGEWRLRKGEIFVASGTKGATFFVPLIITGSYELKVDIKASEDGGVISTLLPVLRGHQDVHNKLKGPGSGGFSDGLIETWVVEKRKRAPGSSMAAMKKSIRLGK